MRKVMTAVVTAAVMLVGANVASAAFIVGTPGDDVPLTGTRFADVINARAGNDFVRGLRGADDIDAGIDEDFVRANRGNDFVDLRDGYYDRANCGLGFDKVAPDFHWYDGYVYVDDDVWNCDVIVIPGNDIFVPGP